MNTAHARMRRRAPESTFSYGPGNDPREQSVQVVARWEQNVLSVHDINRECPRFVIGDKLTRGDSVFTLPGEQIGETPRVLIEYRGALLPVIYLDPSMRGYWLQPDGARTDVVLHPTARAQELELPLHSLLVVQVGAVTFDVSHDSGEARWARAFVTDDIQPVATYFSASFVSIAALLTSAAFFVPPLGLNNGENIDPDRLYLMQQYLDASAERERLEEKTAEESDQSGGQEGARAAKEEGALGTPNTQNTSGKLAVRGAPGPKQPAPMQREEATTFGMIGLLAGGSSVAAVNSPWQRDVALGDDPLNAQGALWGDELKDSIGAGGLGVTGLSEGGGGQHDGIGIGEVGTIGGGGRCVGASCPGMGVGADRNGGTHIGRSPRIRQVSVSMSGRLPPETVQRIVRQNFGKFRLCYEQGLGRNPNLQGRVQVRFLIDRTGHVGSASNGGSSLRDSTVVGCVVRTFYGITFPKPEVGSVSVTYPISFSPE